MRKHRIVSLLTITVVCAILCGVLSGCGKAESIDPAKYDSYICYDYHLRCRKVEKEYADSTRTFLPEGYKLLPESYQKEETVKIRYFRIQKESDEKFIFLWPLSATGSRSGGFECSRAVFQNPDQYVDVCREWTVKKVELYYLDSRHFIHQKEPCNTPNGIIETTKNADALREIKDALTCEDRYRNERHRFDGPKGFKDEGLDDHGAGRLYYLRVSFNESDNIVWESEVLCLCPSDPADTSDWQLYLDVGAAPEDILSNNEFYVPIEKGQHLYDWIISSIRNSY